MIEFNLLTAPTLEMGEVERVYSCQFGTKSPGLGHGIDLRSGHVGSLWENSGKCTPVACTIL